ncbi:WD40 repeat domain-containing protein, partial [Nonomuraea longicatena]|uniref:WD40 repeat domain-containing protein n=1 Tax=Nonomuraea longicatena TaxID=83682 RepID=UPI003CD06BC1
IAFATLPDGTPLLATGSHDHTVRLWNPATGSQRTTLVGHASAVSAVAFATLADGTPLLATGSHDHTVRLWNPATPTATDGLPLSASVRALAHASSRLAIGTDHGVLMFDLGKPTLPEQTFAAR